ALSGDAFWHQVRSRPPIIVAQFGPRDPTDAQSLWLSFPALVTLLPADSACDAPLVWPAALSPHRRALWVAMLRERRPVSLIHFDRALPFCLPPRFLPGSAPMGLPKIWG